MSLLRHRVLLPAALSAVPLRNRDLRSRAQATPCALLAPVLYLWLCCGVVCLALFPALRGADPLLGWWPFWLLLWPSSSMGLLWWCRRGREAAR